MIDILRLFSKTDPYVSLYSHCLDTGNAAGALWDLGVISREIIERDALCLLVSLHDLGKCHPCFQKIGVGIVPYADELMSGGFLPANDKEYRHEMGSESIILSKKDKFIDKKTAKAVAKILRLHHQKSEWNSKPSPKEGEWVRAQDEFIAVMEKCFGIQLNAIIFNVCDKVCTMLWGIVILSDWLVSGGISDKIGILFEKKILEPKSTSDMFGIKTLRPLQIKCEEVASGFTKAKLPSAIIIEAPMGEGKTEAALYLTAQFLALTDKNGFYIALPTMATARQMEKRISDLLITNGLGSSRLVYSEAWLDSDVRASQDIDKSWFAPTKRSLLSNYAVGTVDQAMMSVLRIKQGVLRLLGLSTKVLVIDEIHAYDAYMQTIIFRLLEWCAVLGIPVIILSATLPRERKERLLDVYGCKHTEVSGAYPLITSVYKNGWFSETAVEGTYIDRDVIWESIVFTNYKDIALRALVSIKDGGCTCVIMNTVKDAQEVYSECKNGATSDIKLFLFHSRFLSKDRKQIEEECLKIFGKDTDNRPQKALLIATQVVEQSFDVDFDYMISALAPVDLLLQRSGRLHRHSRERPQFLAKPRFTVLINGDAPLSQGIGRIYEPWILAKTEEVIRKRSIVNIPRDIRALIEDVYGCSPEPIDNMFEAWIAQKSGQAIMEGTAKQFVYPSPEPDCFFPLESGDFFDEVDGQLVNFDAATRFGGNDMKIALLPDSLWDSAGLNDSKPAYARIVMDYSISVRLPYTCELIRTEELIECGGYLKGLFAVRGEGAFTLQFTLKHYTVIKKYTVDKEYGLKEEKC